MEGSRKTSADEISLNDDKNKSEEDLGKGKLSTLGASLLVVLLCFFVVMGVLHVRSEAERYQQQEFEAVQQQLDVIRADLKNRVYSNIYKISAVKALVAMKPDLSQDDFARAMAVQFSGENDLRNIGLARDMILEYMHPIKGNEAAVGLDYRTVPEQLEAVDLALRLNEIILAGPLTLVQGGEGIIARIPIHIPDPASTQEAFWGFASVVMDSESIFAGAGIRDDHETLRIALRGRDALGAEGEVFWGEASVFDENPVTYPVELPYGTWQMAAIPAGGWGAYAPFADPLIWMYLIATGIVLSLVALMVFLLNKMERTEHERSRLSRSLEVFLDQTSDFVYYKDSDSRFVFCSQTLAEITHHRHWKDMIGKHDFEVFPPDVSKIYHEEERPVFEEGKPLLNKVNPYYSAAGETGYVQTNKWPVYDSRHRVSGIFGISRDITQQKKNIESLEKERALFAEGPVFTLEWAPEPSDNLPLIDFSSNVEKILGYSFEDLLHQEFSYSALIHPDDLKQVIDKLAHHIDNHIDFFEDSYRLKTKFGEYIWVYEFTMLVRDEVGRLTSIRSYLYDKTAQIKTEEALRIAEARLEKTAYDLTENIPIGTYTMVQPPQGGMASFEFMSRRFLKLTGLTREEAASDPLKAFACVHPEDYDGWVALNASAFNEKKPFYGETRVVVKGEIRWVTAESTPRTLSDGTTVWEGVLADITEQKKAQEQLKIMATIDELSQLNNRRYFMELAGKAFEEAVAHQEAFGVLIIDIDRFKRVNDQWGHAAGDAVIREMGKRIKEWFNEKAISGRLGGEEFAVFMPHCTLQELVEQADGFREKIAATKIDGGEHIIHVTISIGVSGYVQEAKNLGDLLRWADEALYASKEGGRNRVSVRSGMV